LGAAVRSEPRVYTSPQMRAHRDPDLLLVKQMLAPPSVDDARSSLEYWQRRREALPVYRRAARREAKEMAARWHDRLLAAEQVRFEASLAGRLLARVGISRLWLLRARFTKLGLISLAWSFVPRNVKLVAGGVAAAWLIMLAAGLTAAVLVFDQVL
jgi:hypothetical protein